MKKTILDPCCGSRMFWFDDKNPLTIFGDIRREYYSMTDRDKSRTCVINPDVKMDFRNIPYQDKRFKLVVFDPPHLKTLGKNSWMCKKYGKLSENWKEDIKIGFSECFRVLDNDGVLIFKWNEYEIKVREVLDLANYRPLFGNKSGKSQKTHWIAFMKNDVFKDGEENNG